MIRTWLMLGVGARATFRDAQSSVCGIVPSGVRGKIVGKTSAYHLSDIRNGTLIPFENPRRGGRVTHT